MSDINLLPKSVFAPQAQDYTAVILRRTSFLILFITAVVTISLFLLVLTSPLEKARQREQTLLETLDLSKAKISKNVIMNERLVSITKVLKERNRYEKNIGAVLDVLPETVILTSMEVSKKDMQITGNSTSLDALNTFINSLVAMQNKKELIQSLTLRSAALQKEAGRYYFTLDILFL